MPVPVGGDRLADVADLMRMPGVPADLDESSAWLLIEIATAVVQEAAGGQRILQVVDDTVTLYGSVASHLALPQRPITAVTSVTHNGALLTEGTATGTWRMAAGGIWRDTGWAVDIYEPTQTEVVYTHGYPEGDQRLLLGRSAVLGLAKGVAANPTGATSLRIDDYAEAYAAVSAALEASPALKAALARQYGPRAGLVRIT